MSAFDFSVGYSNEISILAATNPSQPYAPVLAINDMDVLITWIAPDANGSPILGYRVKIRQNDLLYTEELVNCDGSTAVIRDATSCSIPISVLTASPYSLPWGSNVYAKVIAYNDYGDSLVSDPGSEAIILTIPDAPVGLTEEISARSADSISFTWSPGPANGGADVLDYRISFD